MERCSEMRNEDFRKRTTLDAKSEILGANL